MPDMKVFHAFIDDVDALCEKYGISYETLKTTVELLDNFGWENDPAMILDALVKEVEKEGEIDE